ncbi:1127_t:CDS:1 [Dentiscutata heterogama]|uniref:1127_t:CDS:1 n=1 Tax=Dentiscutata heterogama TaxID=1316150 RepID=A0ACA9MI63_9GLOM|nr:1127_t:CDS:1 [Dentiscutata heterogama]
MKEFKKIQDNRPSNNNSVNLFSSSENKSFSSKKISINNIMFGIQSYKTADDICPIVSNQKNLCDISKNFEADDDMSFELENKNNISFEVANDEEFIKIL